MKKWLSKIQWIILYSATWCILFERLDVSILISGFIVSLFSLHFTEKFLIGMSYTKQFPINIFWFLKYFFFLLIEIYKAGFTTMKMVFTKDINPGVVDIYTTLEEPHKIAILANSITLTPGTVTIDKEGQHLKVLWLNVKSKKSRKAGDIIKGNLENLF